MDSQSAQIIIEHRNKFGYFFSPTELFSIRDIEKLVESILPFIKTSRLEEGLIRNEESMESSESFFKMSKITLRSRVTK
ncbi:MAG: helix-hairpin-helix domain-containing protein [Ignavibacteriales bacterium]|nr:helix-hairpin-helix domain-containing protein [Ignavibacteriales bacterium]